MTRKEIRTEVLVRLGTDTTAGFYTEAMLDGWINQAHIWACGYKKWPFTEYRDKSKAFVAGTEEYAYPNAGFKSDSIRLLKIGSSANMTENDNFGKKNFDDYMRYREARPAGADKIFSDYERIVFINPNCAGGTIYAFGQLKPADLVLGDGGDASETKFSGAEEEGDNAIIEKVLGYAAKKAKQDVIMKAQYELAKEILEEIWTKIKGEQHAYQAKDRSMFREIDVLNGNFRGAGNNPLQFE